MFEVKKNRKFSLEDDFMNLETNDLLLGYIQHLATFMPEKEILYVPVEEVIKERKKIMFIIGKRSVNTVNYQIAKLVDKGLIKKEILIINNKQVECYIMPQITKGSYELINNGLLWYIVQTRNLNSLKIYLYLLNKYKWKSKSGEKYTFTVKEISEALGYSSDSKTGSITSIINTILQSMKREGLLDYKDYIDTQHSLHATTRKKLLFMATSIDQLKNPNGSPTGGT